MKYVLMFVAIVVLAACTLTGCAAPAVPVSAKAAEVAVPDQPLAEKEVVEASSTLTETVSPSEEVIVVPATGALATDLTYTVSEDGEMVLFNFGQVAPYHVYVDSVFQEGHALLPAAGFSWPIDEIKESIEVVILPDDSELVTKLYLTLDKLVQSAGGDVATSNTSTGVLTGTAATTMDSGVQPVTTVADVVLEGATPCTESWTLHSDGMATMSLKSDLGYHWVSMDNGTVDVDFADNNIQDVSLLIDTPENKGALLEIYSASNVTVTVNMGTHRPDATLCEFASPVSQPYISRERAAKVSPSGVMPQLVQISTTGVVQLP